MSKKISVRQFVLLLYLCRMFSTMTYNPAMGVGSGGVSVLIAWAISLGVGILVLLPALWLHSINGEENAVSLSLLVWNKGGAAAALLYFAFMMMTAVSAFANFTFFMTDAVFPQSSALFFIATMWIAAVYAACMGLESIARTGVIVFAAFVISLGFIAFASADQAELTELRLPLGNMGQEIAGSVYESFSRSTEFAAVLLLLPYLKGNLKKGIAALLCMIVVTAEIIAFLLLTVLGDFSATQTVPYYTLSSVAEFSIFQRLDALHMTVWVAMALVKIALYLFLSIECVRLLFPQRLHRGVSAVCCGLLLLLVLPFCYSREAFAGLYRVFSSGIPAVLLVIVLPLLIGISAKCRKGGKSHEKSRRVPGGASVAAGVGE